MGPSQNQNRPASSNHGSILPVPDVEGVPQPVIVTQTEPNGLRKWMLASLISAGVLALAGIVVFAVYAYTTSTPKYVLGAAMSNFATSEGQAGDYTYESTANNKTLKADGDFLIYSDPTNDKNGAATFSVGHNASRMSANIALFSDGNIIQFIGLGNISRLLTSAGATSSLSKDSLVRLSNLDGQWYSQTANDIWQLKPVTSQHTLQGAANSSIIESATGLYEKHPFITVAQHLGDESIDGAKSMHLKLSIDRTTLGQYLHALKSAEPNTLMLTDNDITSITTSDAWNHLSTDVWIARSDRTFRKMSFTYNDGGRTQTVTITYHNEQVATQRQAISRPENVKSFSTFVDQVTDILGDNAKSHR